MASQLAKPCDRLYVIHVPYPSVREMILVSTDASYDDRVDLATEFSASIQKRASNLLQRYKTRGHNLHVDDSLSLVDLVSWRAMFKADLNQATLDYCRFLSSVLLERAAELRPKFIAIGASPEEAGIFARLGLNSMLQGTSIHSLTQSTGNNTVTKALTTANILNTPSFSLLLANTHAKHPTPF
jgi:hypothetical protein